MKKKEKRFFDKVKGIAFVVVLLVLFIMYLSGWSLIENPTQNDLSGQYELTEKKTKVVRIFGQPAVRSEPIVVDKSQASNSFGSVKKSNGFTIAVTKTYGTKEPLDDKNGSFVGLSVKEVLATAEGKEWFPSGITKDPDGIVWISADYITVVA